jgi:hypothetical protein
VEADLFFPLIKPESLKAAADRCAKELGGIDFVM